MPYITSVERIGMRKGGQKSILQILEVMFKDIPQEFRELIGKIEALEVL